MLKKIVSFFKEKTGSPVEVSFLPAEEETKEENLKRQKITLIVVFFLVLLISFSLWGFFLIRLNRLQLEVKEKRQELNKIEEILMTRNSEIQSIQSIATRIPPAETLLQKHLFVSNFFKILEEKTIPEINFNDIRIDNKNIFLNGAAKSYEAIARQIIAFKTVPFVEDLKVSGLSTKISLKGEVEGVDFSLTLTVSPAIFKP
jgi:hypothetical protein